MPTTHSAMGFSDVTGHVLAPVGELAWLCIGLSCKQTNKKTTSSCFDRSWLNFEKSSLEAACVCITFHIADLCLSPRLSYPTAYLTFLLGSKATRYLKFNMSTPNSRCFFPQPTCSSPSPSHLSRWYYLSPSCSGQKYLGVILGPSFSLPHIQYISKI